MKAIRLTWLELRRFRGRSRWLLPVALALIPPLLGSLFLWANWDPYGRLSDVPVAVVNSDQPVRSQGERIAVGDQFVRQLQATDLFEWHVVDQETALRGLASGRYYVTITVPEDFSAKLATFTSPAPRRAALLISKNDANGYLAGVLADTAMVRLQNQVNTAAHAAYARSAYRELDQVRQRLTDAAELSDRLARGVDAGRQESGALAEGLRALRAGSGQVADAAQRVSAASSTLDEQLSNLRSFTTEQLPGVVNALHAASATAVNSLSTIKTATGFLADKAGDHVTTLEALGQRHPDTASDVLFQQALGNAKQLAGASRNADGEAGRALAAAQEANRQAVALSNDLGPLRQRIQTITGPSDALRAGSDQLAGGADGMSGSLQELADRSTTLRGGADQLGAETRRLTMLVGESLERIPPADAQQLAHTADVLGSPAQLKTTNLNPADVYGRGLAPLLVSIALWVFGLFAYFVLPPVNTRLLTGGAGAMTVTMAGWLPAALLGTLGALGLFGVLNVGLGLEPRWHWATLGVIGLGTLTFVALGHLLRAVFGAAGHLLSVLLLFAQLVASGGLYPLETSPEPVRWVHDFLPMTYLVDGLRVTISGGLSEHLVRDVTVLGGCLVASLVLTAVVVGGRRRWTLRRLYPAWG